MDVNNQELASERQKDLEIARKLLKKLERRLDADRFRSYETDSNYLSFIRAYDHLLSTVNSVSRDLQVEELKAAFEEYRIQLQREKR